MNNDNIIISYNTIRRVVSFSTLNSSLTSSIYTLLVLCCSTNNNISDSSLFWVIVVRSLLLTIVIFEKQRSQLQLVTGIVTITNNCKALEKLEKIHFC